MNKCRRNISLEIIRERRREAKRLSKYRYAAWCDACRAKVDLIVVKESLAGKINVADICEKAATDEYHAGVMFAEKLFICPQFFGAMKQDSAEKGVRQAVALY